MNPGTKETLGSGEKVSFMSLLVKSKSTICLLNCLTVLIYLRESNNLASLITFETIKEDRRSP